MSGPGIHWDSAALRPLKEAHTSGEPVRWVKVHDLADYAFFDHSVHVQSGVGCVSCHGRVDKMEVVYQAEPLSMGWCLDCHRNPEPHLRPVSEVTNMEWTPPGDPIEHGTQLREQYGLAPSEDCSTCHR